MSLNYKIEKTRRNAKILLGTLAALAVFSTAGLVYGSYRGNINGKELLKKTVGVLAVPFSIFMPAGVAEYYLERRLKRNYQEETYQEEMRA